jgi:hypothetical protein
MKLKSINFGKFVSNQRWKFVDIQSHPLREGCKKILDYPAGPDNDK